MGLQNSWLGKVIGLTSNDRGASTSDAAAKAAAAKAVRQKDMTPEARLLDDSIQASTIDAAKVENADPARPRNNVAAIGKPMPGTDFTKTNYVQPDQFEALLKTSNDERARRATEVVVKRSKSTNRPSTKGGTLLTGPLGIPTSGPTSFSSLLGVV